MKDLADRLAALLHEYGSLREGTWQLRKAVLIDSINDSGESGASEVLNWFGADTRDID